MVPNLTNKKIIVSLTSYPARIDVVNTTIESILNQSLKANRIILWLAPEQFPNKEKDLPNKLVELKKYGLIIDWYHDIGSYKKLIPTLKLYPNDIIVTADDDVLYNKEWLNKLYKSYLANPEMIHCHRARKILLNKDKLKPYKQWQIYDKSYKDISGFSVFFTGVGGVLYPPNSLNKNVLNEQEFMELCPKNDDIWFWCNAVLNKTKIKLVENPFIKPNHNTEEYKKDRLWNINKTLNDTCFDHIIKKYPIIIEKLKEENKKADFKKFLKKTFSIFIKIKQSKETKSER